MRAPNCSGFRSDPERPLDHTDSSESGTRLITIVPVVAACFLVFTSLNGSRVLMSLFAIELGASTAAIGVLIGLYALFPLLLSVHAGKVVDRAGGFRPALLGAAGFALGLLVPVFFPTLAALYVSAALGGLSLVFFGVATQYLVSSMGGSEARNRNVSIYSLGLALTGLSGPPLTGFVIDQWGHGVAFVMLAVFVVAALAIWAGFRRAIPGRVPRSQPPEPRPALELLRLPALRRIIVVSGLVVAAVDLFSFYMPIYGHSIGLSATRIGLIFGSFAIATFSVRGLLPWLIRRFGEDRVIAGSLAIAALGYAALPFSASLPVLLALAFVLGLGLGCGQPLSLIMLSNRSPEGRAGEAIGLRFTVVNFMHLAIPVLFGAVSAVVGLLPVFLANAGLLLTGSYLSRVRAR